MTRQLRCAAVAFVLRLLSILCSLLTRNNKFFFAGIAEAPPGFAFANSRPPDPGHFRRLFSRASTSTTGAKPKTPHLMAHDATVLAAQSASATASVSRPAEELEETEEGGDREDREGDGDDESPEPQRQGRFWAGLPALLGVRGGADRSQKSAPVPSSPSDSAAPPQAVRAVQSRAVVDGEWTRQLTGENLHYLTQGGLWLLFSAVESAALAPVAERRRLMSTLNKIVSMDSKAREFFCLRVPTVLSLASAVDLRSESRSWLLWRGKDSSSSERDAEKARCLAAETLLVLLGAGGGGANRQEEREGSVVAPGMSVSQYARLQLASDKRALDALRKSATSDQKTLADLDQRYADIKARRLGGGKGEKEKEKEKGRDRSSPSEGQVDRQGGVSGAWGLDEEDGSDASLPWTDLRKFRSLVGQIQQSQSEEAEGGGGSKGLEGEGERKTGSEETGERGGNGTTVDAQSVNASANVMKTETDVERESVGVTVELDSVGKQTFMSDNGTLTGVAISTEVLSDVKPVSVAAVERKEVDEELREVEKRRAAVSRRLGAILTCLQLAKEAKNAGRGEDGGSGEAGWEEDEGGSSGGVWGLLSGAFRFSRGGGSKQERSRKWSDDPNVQAALRLFEAVRNSTRLSKEDSDPLPEGTLFAVPVFAPGGHQRQRSLQAAAAGVQLVLSEERQRVKEEGNARAFGGFSSSLLHSLSVSLDASASYLGLAPLASSLMDELPPEIERDLSARGLQVDTAVGGGGPFGPGVLATGSASSVPTALSLRPEAPAAWQHPFGDLQLPRALKARTEKDTKSEGKGSGEGGEEGGERGQGEREAGGKGKRREEWGKTEWALGKGGGPVGGWSIVLLFIPEGGGGKVEAVANVELSGPDTPTGAAGQLTAFVNSVGAAVYLHALSRGVRRGDLSLQLEALSVLHALCWQVQGAPETLLDMGVLDVLAEALRGSGKVPSAVLPRRQRGREKSRERRGGKKGPRTPPESPLSTPTVNGVRHRAACEAVQLHIQLRILQLIDALVSSVREERSVRAMQRHDDLFAVVTGLASYAEAVKQEMGRAREREAELRRRQFGGSDPDSLPSSLASNDSVLHPDFSLAPLLETREKEKGPQEETGGALRPPLLMPSGVAAAGGVRGEPGERAGSDRGEEESEGSEEDIEIEGDSQGVRARLRALPSAFFQIFTPEQGKAELAASAALNSSAASLEIPVVERDKENSDGVFGGWGVVGRVRKLWSRGEKESSGGVEGGVTPEAGKGLKETSQVVDAYLGVMNVSKFNQSALTAAQNLSTSLIVPSEGEPGSSSVEQGEGKGLLSVGEFSNATRDGLLSEREREKQPLDHVFETEEMEKGKGWGIFRRVRSAFSSSSGPSSSPSETGAAVGLDNPTGGQVHALSLSSVLSSALGEAAAGVRAGVGVDREREKDRNLLAMDGLLREREELLRLVQAEMGWALGGPSSRRGGRRKRGLRILSLDGGGTRGVLTIAMLKHLVAACGGKELHEVFDFICGTSTGAIIGMLAAMGEPIAEIERKYDSWIGRIFKKDNIVWSMSRYIRMGYYDDVNWENILREILGDDRMIDLSRKGGPQLMTLSVRLGASPPDLCVWRTYNFPPWSPKGAHFPGSFKVKCREALRATTAAPLYFSPVQLENEWFVDGSIIANNPAAVALQEVTRLYPGEPVDLLVSVGTSVPHSFREIQKRERDQLERMEEEKRKAEREAPGPAAPLNGSDSKPPLELGQQERGQGENLMKGVGEREAGTRKREETDFSLSSLNTSTVSTTTTPATLSNPSPYSLEETKPTLPPFPSKPLSGSTRSRGLEYVLPSADDFADLPGFESGPMPRRGTPASSSSSRGSPSSLFDLSTSSGNALPPTGLSGVALNPLAWRESIGDSLFQDGGGGTFFEDSSRASPSPSTSSPETLLRETQYESADGYEPVSDAQVHLALLESEATAAAAAAASSPDSPPSSMTGDETEGMEGDQVQDPQRQGTWRTLLDVLDQVVQSAVDTEYIHSMLSLWFNELLPIEKSLGGSLPLSGTEGQRGGPKRPGAVYVRFNPKMEYAPIDETDPEKLDVLKKVAHRYFTDVPEVVQELKLVADIVALDSQQQSQRSHTSGGLRQRGGKSRSRKRRSQRSNSKRRRGISSWFKGWFSQPD